MSTELPTSESEAQQTLPADRGLSGLGLGMQFIGPLFIGGWLFVVLDALFLSARANNGVFVAAFCALGSLRAGWGWGVGVNLAEGELGSIFALRAFALSGFVYAPAMAYLARKSSESAATIPFTLIALVFLAWPAALTGLSMRPSISVLNRAERHTKTVAQPRNWGLEGLGGLMVVFGLSGLVWVGVVAYAAAHEKATGGFLVGVAIALAFFALRAVAQIVAGVTAFRESRVHASRSARARLDRVDAAMRRYARLGIVSAAVFGAVLFASMLTVGGVAILVALLPFGPLIVWPVTVSRYMNSIRRRTGAVPSVELSPSEDGGASALSFLMIGASSFMVALLVGRAVGGPPGAETADAISLSLVPTWALGLGAGAALTAGIALVLGVSWARFAALAYAAMGGAVGLWNVAKIAQQLREIEHVSTDHFSLAVTLWVAVLSVIVPVVIAVLCVRTLRIPRLVDAT